MKPFFSSRISRLGGLITLSVLSITTFSASVMADPIRDLQNEVAKRGISSESVNTAMRTGFPDSAFPYYEPVNGCSTPLGVSFGWGNNQLFEGACNQHDKCYMTPGTSKFSCDNEMFESISRICANRNNPCSITADTYYWGVDKYGQEPYETSRRRQVDYIKAVYAWLSTKETNIVFSTNSSLDTGISIKSGDKIRVRASGTIRFGLLAGSGGPNGIIIDPTYNYFLDVPHGRLMARFRQPGMGDWEGWSPIGAGSNEVREVKLSAPGILEFSVNDNEPDNNIGTFRIEVTIYAGKQ
jgi:hypothetical protein